MKTSLFGGEGKLQIYIDFKVSAMKNLWLLYDKNGKQGLILKRKEKLALYKGVYFFSKMKAIRNCICF